VAELTGASSPRLVSRAISSPGYLAAQAPSPMVMGRASFKQNPYKIFSANELTSKKSGNLSSFRDMRKKISGSPPKSLIIVVSSQCM
jgi:hypothetical protein